MTYLSESDIAEFPVLTRTIRIGEALSLFHRLDIGEVELSFVVSELGEVLDSTSVTRAVALHTSHVDGSLSYADYYSAIESLF